MYLVKKVKTINNPPKPIFTIDFVGDRALQIVFYDKNINFKALINQLKFSEIIDVCFSYQTLTLFFEPVTTNAQEFKNKVHNFLDNLIDWNSVFYNVKDDSSQQEIIKIPACFCKTCAIDWDRAEKYTKMSFDEFITKYTNITYKVLFIGFQPGFPFLEGLPEQLSIPRLERPRLRVPAGSVGIGGRQTGIYTFPTPGGWNIIGKTYIKLFDIKKGAFLQSGHYIKFTVSTCKQ
ncbi:MAG: 5-oxoprolinase subunit B family protein [Planctomycetota bacterium]